MTVRAKICGIRSETDLRIAVEAGADAVGFISGITHFSEDGLDADEARRLASLVPPFVNKVLVTHLEEADAIIALADRIGVDTIQVHGLVSTETLRKVTAAANGRTVLRAVHVTGADAIQDAKTAAANCDAVLLDSRTTDRLGGTGRTHDWSISARIVAELSSLGCPVVLAGGLTAANVGEAISAVNPFGVDVNSGVEDSNGDKSPQACGSFVASAHAWSVATTVPSQQH
ncbi:phosphoribosylanthranilate isomerase [Nocardia sp. NPDC057663]|uniref:phosphoribosylanthranilate isomerase n=1 Tax=Nocardia sp. NPDC057663 TaxID=3346201 RepID=UPI00366AA0D1